jgi:hypothetical protein
VKRKGTPPKGGRPIENTCNRSGVVNAPEQANNIGKKWKECTSGRFRGITALGKMQKRKNHTVTPRYVEEGESWFHYSEWRI